MSRRARRWMGAAVASVVTVAVVWLPRWAGGLRLLCHGQGISVT
jgi:hypothetical protein